MRRIEAIGKNVEQAIESGLEQLKVTRDKVTIEVKDTGGLFKKAKVVLTVDEDFDAEERKEVAEDIEGLESQQERGESNSDFSSLLKTSNEGKTTAKNAENKGKSEEDENSICSCDKTIIEAKSVARDEGKADESEEGESFSQCEESGALKSDFEDESEEVKFSKGAVKIKEFADEVLKLMGIEASVEISETKDNVDVEIVGSCANKIIGKRGDGLNALQYLCSVISSRIDRDCGRVSINACGYREEREQELIKLARKLKYSAVRDEKAIKLEPMTALDRKTIHKALKDDDLVETHSEGEEPKRYIVISPKSSEK